jgi:hypothetical protein
MSTAVAERKTAAADEPQDELAIFRKQDAIVADLREKYMSLTIKGIERQEGIRGRSRRPHDRQEGSCRCRKNSHNAQG